MSHPSRGTTLDAYLELTPDASRFRLPQARNYLGEGSVIEAILANEGPYQKLLASYLKEFRTSGSQVVCTPSAQSRLEYGDIRNLLMQFGMVSHLTEDDSYLLHENANHLYFWAKNNSGASSKEQLQQNAKRKDALGVAAEERAFLIGTTWTLGGLKASTCISHSINSQPNSA
jgi:hypothetical protein